MARPVLRRPIRRPQGHPHRRGGRAFRRPGAEDTMSIEITSRCWKPTVPSFAAALEAHTRHYSVDITDLQKVESISVTGCRHGHRQDRQRHASLQSKTVILATGARWRSGRAGERNTATRRHLLPAPTARSSEVSASPSRRWHRVSRPPSTWLAAVDHVTLFEFMPELRADAVLQQAGKPAQREDHEERSRSPRSKASDKVSAIVYRTAPTTASTKWRWKACSSDRPGA